MNAAIGRVTPATLPEVGCDIIELSPGDGHLVAVCGINRNNALVRSVANDVLAILIDVGLVTREHAELRDHSRRSFHLSRERRWVIIFFQWLVSGRRVRGG